METEVFLRVLEPDDLERVYKWHNDHGLYQKLIGTYHLVNRATVEKWLTQKGDFSNSEINCAVCLKSNSQHIGNIYLRDINWIDRNATIHVFIGDYEHRQKGYGKQAITLMMDYACRTLGLNRIYTLILANNAISLKMFQSVGFAEEGTMRKHVYQEGQFHDVLVLGYCKENERKNV